MNITDVFGYAAAGLVLLTFSMKTMVPLRIAGIASNIFFIAYGYLSDAMPILSLHLILLPLNILRLYQILHLIREVEHASKAHSEPNLEWLHSIGSDRWVKAGEILFQKGDPADRMFFIVTGTFRITELGIELHKGQLLGEIGLLSKKHARTQTVECISEARLLEVTYDRVKQLYFQSPRFGFFFMRLVVQRLLDNIERQERELEQYRKGAQSSANSTSEPKKTAKS